MSSSHADHVVDIYEQFRRSSGALLVETFALLEGRKRAMRVVVPQGRVDAVAAGLIDCGLFVGVASSSLLDVRVSVFGERFSTWNGAAREDLGRTAIYTALQPDVVDAVRELDRAQRSRELGEYLGYPPCCAEAYCDRVPGIEWWFTYANGAGDQAGYPAITNKLASLLGPGAFLYDYFPCSVNCRESTALAERNVQSLAGAGLRSLVDIWLEWHSGLFVVARSFVARCSNERRVLSCRTVDGYPRRGQRIDTIGDERGELCVNVGGRREPIQVLEFD